jgi:NhaP-type Na+/H+ or K+/H+ antiporter
LFHLSRRDRWLRWLAVWLTLITALGFGLSYLVGPLAPTQLPWVGAFILGSALTFFFVPSPDEDE